MENNKDKKRWISVQVEEDLFRGIGMVAAQRGLNRSQLLRELLTKAWQDRDFDYSKPCEGKNEASA